MTSSSPVPVSPEKLAELRHRAESVLAIPADLAPHVVERYREASLITAVDVLPLDLLAVLDDRDRLAARVASLDDAYETAVAAGRQALRERDEARARIKELETAAARINQIASGPQRQVLVDIILAGEDWIEQLDSGNDAGGTTYGLVADMVHALDRFREATAGAAGPAGDPPPVADAVRRHLAGLDSDLSLTSHAIAERIGASHAETCDVLAELTEAGEVEMLGIADEPGGEPWLYTFRRARGPAGDPETEGADRG